MEGVEGAGSSIGECSEMSLPTLPLVRFVPRRLLLAVALPGLLAAVLAPVTAEAVTLRVENIQGQVPDADDFLSGDSDPYAVVFIEGIQAGVTPVLPGTNAPDWTGSAFQLVLPLDPQVTPLATIEIDVYDQDNGSDEFLGTATFSFDWTQGGSEIQTEPLLGPLGPGQVTARLRAILDPIGVESRSWGRTKADFAD